MKKPMVRFLAAVVLIASTASFGFVPGTVLAATPQLSVNNEGGYARIVVSNADSYAPITLYTREQGSGLWSNVVNFGTTDNSGYFSNLYRASQLPFEYYVTVNGVQSSTQQIGFYQNNYCSGYYCGGGISLSQTSLTLNSGQSSVVTIYGSGSYYVSSNSNSNVATASISGNQLTVYGSSNGTASLSVCSYSGNYGCSNLYVTVTGYNNYNYNYGNVSLSQTSITLGSGQSSVVTIYGSGSYYVSSNSNSNVATASISGNQLTVYGNNYGSNTITVCSSGYSYNCASLYVSVSSYGNAYDSLSFINTNLPQPQTGSYYHQQLSVSGGTYPYTFSLTSGSLPPGLSLSSGGIISGVTNQYVNQNYTFTIQVRDSQWRMATNTFSLSVGTNNYYNYQYPYSHYPNVQGAYSYGNGAIIREGQTLFITYRNTKTPFANANSFLGFGFKFNNAMDTGNLNLVQSGRIIATSQTQHPFGTWIKWGNTVYMVSEGGLIPVPSWDVFTNNGGSDAWVVMANIYDTQLPVLTIMTYGDSRLR